MQTLEFVHMDDPKSRDSFSFVYFHGALERHVEAVTETLTNPEDYFSAPDLVGILTSLNHEVEEGIHDCMVYGKPCTLYMWYCDHGPGYTRHQPRGLICDNTDTDYRLGALNAYTGRKGCL